MQKFAKILFAMISISLACWGLWIVIDVQAQPRPRPLSVVTKDVSAYEIQRQFTQDSVSMARVSGSRRVDIRTRRNGVNVVVERRDAQGRLLGVVSSHESRRDMFRDGKLRRRTADIVDPNDPRAVRLRERPERELR